MSQSYELIVVAGPMKGERFPLAPDRATRIGRASKGVPLTLDDQASLDHAEIYPRQGRFYIVDLESHSGTFVNGTRVADQPVEVVPGSVLEIGTSVIRVEDRSSGSRWIGLAVAIGVPVLTTLLMLAWFASRPVLYEPAFRTADPVHQRVRTSNVVPVPEDFVRDWGVDHRGLTLEKVTDHDQDEVDELWLGMGDRMLVVTFNDRGGWEILGNLPSGCLEHRAVDFPDLACDGMIWQFRDGRYQPSYLDGLIAWARPWLLENPAEVAEGQEPRYLPGALQPYRMTLVLPDRLKGFLAARGVDEPIHYLICEEAVRGVRAQVLTEAGRLETLDYGCLGAVRISGPDDERGADKPQAFAFTVTGVQALADDLRTFLSGGPSGLFLNEEQRALVAAASGDPTSRAATRVTFLGESTEGRAVAPEGPLEGVRFPARSGSVEGVRPVVAASIRSQGVATLDPPGCSELQVETRGFHCKLLRWCTPGRTFLTVRQIGCGETRVLATMPYSGGVARGGDAHVDVVVRSDVVGARGQIDVLRTRVGYRVKDVQVGSASAP